MNIAITGAGDIGATLTLRLTALGHHVRVANSRGPETLAALAKETGAHPHRAGRGHPRSGSGDRRTAAESDRDLQTATC